MYNQRQGINSKPGITGYWQVYGNRARGCNNLLSMEKYYEGHKSFSLYITIILKTIKILVTASHSDSIIEELTQKYNQAQVIDIVPNIDVK